MKTRMFSAGAAVLLMCGLLGCASKSTSYSYTDPRFEPTDVNTYAWDPAGNIMEGVVPEHRLVLNAATLAAVDEQLAIRGWDRVEPDKADIYVRYAVGARSRHEVTQTGTMTIGNTRSTVPVKTRLMRDGELAIDLIDTSTSEILWRGVGQGTSEGVLPSSQVYEKVTQGVRHILKQLP